MSKAKRKPISLALQGGGALGAYTWGALDRLLEDERIEIAAISGASAGAMCAVVLAEGFHDGGAEGARANLRKFSDIDSWAKVLAGEAVDTQAAPDDRAFLADALELLPPEPWDETTWTQWTGALKEKSGRKGRALFHPLRLALTGRDDGPDFRSLLPLLGRKVCRDRLS